MTFLLTFGLGMLGVALAGAVVRAALTEGTGPSPWARALAAGGVALIAATGLVEAGDTYKLLRDRHAGWAPVSEQDALENNSVGNHVDPAFTRFAKERMVRGETWYPTSGMANETKLWLAYRLAPNLLEDKPGEADWILYWGMTDPYRSLGLSKEQVTALHPWSADIGLLKVAR